MIILETTLAWFSLVRSFFPLDDPRRSSSASLCGLRLIEELDKVFLQAARLVAFIVTINYRLNDVLRVF